MIEPTYNQLAVRDAPPSSLLVLAPAGCGKTEALALRAEGLAAGNDTARKILVATFTNRARENVRDRLAAHMTESTIRKHVSVSNFHGFSARIIRSHGRSGGYLDGLEMPEADWITRRCRKLGLGYKATSEVNEILGKVKREQIDDNAVIARLEDLEVQQALTVEKQRQHERVLTYDDLPRIAELILANESVASLYRSHFAHIIVDEFQDLTLQQLRILHRIGFGRTTYAGDLAQGIYSFAGAEPDSILSAVRNEVGESIIEFTESHRSSPAVLSMVNALATRVGGQQLTCAKPSSWPGGGVASRLNFADPTSEACYIRQFAEGVAARIPRSRVGVVARTKGRQRFLDANFRESTVNIYRWDNPVLDAHVAPALKKLLRSLDDQAVREAPDRNRLLTSLIDSSSLQDPSTREGVMDALNWAADELDRGRSSAELIDSVGVTDGDSLLDAPGVHLLTGHAGKGQQFDWVFVVGMEEGCLPDFRAASESAVKEEVRVLSVMISRARHGVILTGCSMVPTNYGNKKSRDPSSFLPLFDSVAECRDRPSLRRWLAEADWEQFDQ